MIDLRVRKNYALETHSIIPYKCNLVLMDLFVKRASSSACKLFFVIKDYYCNINILYGMNT